MRWRRGVLVRIFRPTFFASPLTSLAGAGEKCGAKNESSPRHFEHLCNASKNLLPKTHQIQPATQNPEVPIQETVSMSTGRVIVVGGGVIGAACAYFLKKAGWESVTVLDRGQFGKGCS